MRRSVFLAVWLSLVLSLLKESGTVNTTTPANTTVPTPSKPTENGTVNTTTPANTTVPTPSKPTENGTVNTTTPANTTVPTPSKPTESGTVNTTTPANTTVPTPSKPTENGTVNTTTPANTTVPTPSKPTESGTVNTTTPANTTVPTPSKPTVLVDFCREYPCGRNLATCISLQSNYTCECQYGFYYSEKNCYRGQVYPATIGVRAPYNESLQTVNSTEYEEVFNNITEFFKKAFHNLKEHIQTVIVEIQPAKESRNAALLNVTVTNLFMWNSTVNETSINSAVRLAISSEGENSLYVYSYEEAKHCDVYQCDTQTTMCQERMFPECKCKPDLEKTQWDDRSCSACSKNCSAEAHKYCVKEKTGPACKCMINFKKEGGNCVACPVGYSGENCNDNSELILIIVGTVFGAIILSLVVAVSIISVRAKKPRNPEKRSLIQPEYSNTNRSDDRPSMFPRVQTTSGHANPGYQSDNPYEMRSTNRGHFPERDYDDLYEISREPRGFRMQSRY